MANRRRSGLLNEPIVGQGRQCVAAAARGAYATAPPLTKPLKMVKLGSSDLQVTEVCLGTMTFGEQNTEAEAHEMLSLAADAGVNFLDTAEIYPVAPRPETANRTSTFIGNWLRGQRRDKWVIASKVTGRSTGLDWIPANRTEPPGPREHPRLDGPSIIAACEAELRRLRTDHIDLLQLHWPDRYVALFGRYQYLSHAAREHAAAAEASGHPVVGFGEQVEAVGRLMREGKIRAWGLSNESSWGVMQHCLAADSQGVARPATIQNCYSLLHRTFEGDLAEVCAPHHLNLGLLPWSALAGGALSGKYLPYGTQPAGARLTLFPERYARFTTQRVAAAVAEYVRIAREAGLTPAQLGYAWCRSRPFIPSVIVGATSAAQLRENLGAFANDLSDHTVAAIEEVHNQHRNPALVD